MLDVTLFVTLFEHIHIYQKLQCWQILQKQEQKVSYRCSLPSPLMHCRKDHRITKDRTAKAMKQKMKREAVEKIKEEMKKLRNGN